MSNTGKVNRAAQFLPFDSLKGLQAELRAREEKHSRIEKRELDEETASELSNALAKLEKGSVAEIIYFKGGHYFTFKGIVMRKNDAYKHMETTNGKIFYEDMYRVKIIE